MDALKKVFISYSHDSKDHAARVRGLSDSLRRDGVACVIDQHLPAGPPEGWPLWMEKEIKAADFVLMVCTRTYLRRVMKEEKPGKGLGATWEAHIINQLVYEAGTVNSKFIPVVFDEKDKEHIPTLLRGVNHYRLDEQEGYDNLYPVITEQRRVVKPVVGTVKPVATEAPAPTFGPPGQSKRRENFLEAGVAVNQDFLGRDRELEGVACPTRKRQRRHRSRPDG